LDDIADIVRDYRRAAVDLGRQQFVLRLAEVVIERLLPLRRELADVAEGDVDLVVDQGLEAVFVDALAARHSSSPGIGARPGARRCRGRRGARTRRRGPGGC